jgi:tripartite-type tricarboxylate transporter receptor subunit TctC
MYAAPKGTPQPIVNKLDEAFHKAMDEPEFTRTMAQLDLDIQYRNSEQTKKISPGAVRSSRQNDPRFQYTD